MFCSSVFVVVMVFVKACIWRHNPMKIFHKMQKPFHVLTEEFEDLVLTDDKEDLDQIEFELQQKHRLEALMTLVL